MLTLIPGASGDHKGGPPEKSPKVCLQASKQLIAFCRKHISDVCTKLVIHRIPFFVPECVNCPVPFEFIKKIEKIQKVPLGPLHFSADTSLTHEDAPVWYIVVILPILDLG